ncbi:hypothetical protein [Streptomyces sp. SID3343]|uniref:hypothetical protein n=1 Tax=Streptomyces sp. SID3343 TaxID=2690260 RepID=UPI0013681A19|nr:hypothetical protein [Streptomyces sp. SID3343]MYV97129.1 hypothetical protein [Streptomyces sp. SID3343]
MQYASAFTLLAVLDSDEGELYARVRGAYAPHLDEGRGLPVSLVRSVIRRGTADDLLRLGSHTEDPTVTAEVFAQARPAVAVLRFLRNVARASDSAYLGPMATLTTLLDRHLGADPRAWSRLLALLPDCQGTVTDLIEAAAKGDGGTERIPVAPRTVALEWRQLLMFAPPAHVAALAPHLRPRILHDLVHFGARLPSDVVAAVVGRATDKQRIALCSSIHLRHEAVDALLDLANPELAALLYLNPKSGDYERNRVMARAAEVPPTENLIKRVTSTDNANYRRSTVWSGDPMLVRVGLLRVQRTHAPIQECMRDWRKGGMVALRRRFVDRTGKQHEPFVVPLHRVALLGALLGLWDRHGVAEAERLVDELPLRPNAATRLRATLADGDAGRDRLRAEFDAVCAKPMGKSANTRIGQGFVHHVPTYPRAGWDAVVAAHEAEPLDGDTARRLTAFADCPAEIADAADDGTMLRAQWPVGSGWRPLSDPGNPYEVRRLRIELERIPGLAERVFTDKQGADAALELYRRIQMHAPTVTLRVTQQVAMAEFVREHLGDSMEARVVAAQMAPSFTGTLRELLVTAAAAAG